MAKLHVLSNGIILELISPFKKICLLNFCRFIDRRKFFHNENFPDYSTSMLAQVWLKPLRPNHFLRCFGSNTRFLSAGFLVPDFLHLSAGLLSGTPRHTCWQVSLMISRLLTSKGMCQSFRPYVFITSYHCYDSIASPCVCVWKTDSPTEQPALLQLWKWRQQVRH